MDFAALAKAAALAEPQAAGTVPILHDRTLYLDGDGLAYYCAGNDETELAEARGRLLTKVQAMHRASSAGKVIILLTGSGGHKGHRYAIARVKPYQAQRANSRRPKNWQGLRTMLEDGVFGEVIIDYDREADDRFAQFGHADPTNTVIGTQDKDMQMVPGYHIDWADNRMFYLAPGVDAMFNDKQFGIRWFWLQMLQGDGADNIPGLPLARCKYGGGPINAQLPLNKIGAAGAEKILLAHEALGAAATVALAYQSFYARRWLVEMMEQAALLWMRHTPAAQWDDFCKGGPLGVFETEAEYDTAYDEIAQRVKEASDLNTLSAQVQRDSSST